MHYPSDEYLLDSFFGTDPLGSLINPMASFLNNGFNLKYMCWKGNQ